MDLAVLDRQQQAQTAVIGSMLIDDTCIGAVLATITANDFPGGAYKTAFRAIQKLFTLGRPTDPVTLLDAMQGGDEYRNFLYQCMEVTPTSANVLEYCRILKESTRLTRIADLGQQLVDAPSLDDADAAIRGLNGLLADSNKIQSVTAATMAQEFLERMASPEKPKYIKSGLAGVDKHTYIQLGDMVGIGAEPSAGKTALAVQWALQLAQEYRVGFFSLETGQKKITDRLFAHATDVTLGQIKTKEFTDQNWHQLGHTASNVAQLNFEFVHAVGMTAQDIVAYAVSKRFQVIFVDYLQLVPGEPKKNANRYDIVTEASMTFHTAAQRHNMMTCLLCQLKRPENAKGKPVKPTMHSFRESGQIEQDLDVALIMYLENPNDGKSNRMLRIAKNKEGTKAEVELAFDGSHQRFTEVKPSAYKRIDEAVADVIRADREKKKAEFVQLPMSEEHPF